MAPQEDKHHLPFFLASAMMSAALLLMTFVIYTGQLIRPAMAIARNTASASSWGHSKYKGHGRKGAATPEPMSFFLTVLNREIFHFTGGEENMRSEKSSEESHGRAEDRAMPCAGLETLHRLRGDHCTKRHTNGHGK